MKNTEHITFRDLLDSRMASTFSRNAAFAVETCMVSFFDRYLKGQDDHLLDNPTNGFPVIFNFREIARNWGVLLSRQLKRRNNLRFSSVL